MPEFRQPQQLVILLRHPFRQASGGDRRKPRQDGTDFCTGGGGIGLDIGHCSIGHGMAQQHVASADISQRIAGAGVEPIDNHLAPP
ncbi:hypothetical protein [Rhizobium sp. CNPSo 3490]|uniref:hypothetical protein n=1 Tax=Rhizobium sp. CNPSo 3490 TaxID=3021407 RepID=UPI00254D4AD0|nr:hypothetical protein [Rhizobium sp. CNPSo 3490]MDK4731404.1 hypothetical protein [Rhizobium sp. CNPSo 3490]